LPDLPQTLSAATMRSRTTLRRALLVTAGFALAGCAAIAVALAAGSVPIDAMTILRALTGEGTDTAATIVRELRLPRAMAAFAVGGLLAYAGTLLQVLLRNPLADPYVLGISGGAAVAALSVMLAGAAALVMPAAFGGALASTLIVFGIARTGGARAPWSATRLLLTGIVVAAGWGAAIALLLSVAPDAQVKGMLFWLIGDLSTASASLVPWIILTLTLSAGMMLARDLNALSRGDDLAATLGVAVPRATLAMHALAALATAVAVTVAGSIGFVGLIVPHAVRIVIGNDHRLLLPAAVLTGGTLLVLADTLARTLLAPIQLPVGVVTALVGVPAFLFLLTRGGTRG
jgi:iron complex transport system permease protein